MKSKDLNLYNEMEKHQNYPMNEPLFTFSRAWADFQTIVKNSTTSDSNSNVVFETRYYS